MKIFVMVDMEGISGICHPDQVSPGAPFYAEARRYLTEEVNACVEGCLQGGARSVVVRDAHGGGFHFIWDMLHPGAEYIQGLTARERMPGIATCDGLILLGYHAMAGTEDAVLEHTMSSKAWQNFWLNDRPAGELAIDAGIAGDVDVPTIMTSGDDKLCTEALAAIPDIVAVEVKKGLSSTGAQLLPRDTAHQRIREGAAKAVALCDNIKPFKIEAPVRMKLERVERGRIPAAHPDVKILDGRTYEVTGPDVWSTFNRL